MDISFGLSWQFLEQVLKSVKDLKQVANIDYLEAF